VSRDSEIGRAIVAALDDQTLDLLAERLSPRLNVDETRGPQRIAYTVATLAGELGLSPRAVRAAVQRGELPAVKRGRGYVITASAVEAWAAPNDRKSRRGQPSPRTPPGRGVMTAALADLDTER
jgi:excisionase family DNA binding protein